MAVLGIGKLTPAQRRRRRMRQWRKKQRLQARLSRREVKTGARVERRASKVAGRQKRKTIRTRKGKDLATTVNTMLPDVVQAAGAGAALYAGQPQIAAGIMSAFGDGGPATAETSGVLAAAFDDDLDDDFDDDLGATTTAVAASPGLSTTAKIAIGVGVLGLVGAVAYAVAK